jgi:hypothetical protein
MIDIDTLPEDREEKAKEFLGVWHQKKESYEYDEVATLLSTYESLIRIQTTTERINQIISE